jgi:hypothetical protein
MPNHGFVLHREAAERYGLDFVNLKEEIPYNKWERITSRGINPGPNRKEHLIEGIVKSLEEFREKNPGIYEKIKFVSAVGSVVHPRKKATRFDDADVNVVVDVPLSELEFNTLNTVFFQNSLNKGINMKPMIFIRGRKDLLGEEKRGQMHPYNDWENALYGFIVHVKDDFRPEIEKRNLGYRIFNITRTKGKVRG